MVPVAQRQKVLEYIRKPYNLPENIKHYTSNHSAEKIDEMIEKNFGMKKKATTVYTSDFIKEFGEKHLWKGISEESQMFFEKFESFDAAFSCAMHYRNAQLEFEF